MKGLTLNKIYINDSKGLISANKGNYIRLEGFGILDGLSIPRAKVHFYKIIDINEDNLLLKAYRSRRFSSLSSYNYNQNCEIISKEEFRKLPIYD